MSRLNPLRRRALVENAVVCLVLLVPAFSVAQSLGDVARAERQKQQEKKPSEAKKVITDDDLPQHELDSNPDDQLIDPDEDAPVSDSTAEAKLQQGERWKAQILAQKSSIANLQAQIDRLNSSIHYVEANRYYKGVQHNERQAQKQEQVEQMKKRLDEQKQKVEEMQEAARHAGFGSTVYDP